MYCYSCRLSQHFACRGQDPELIKLALDEQIMLVSPTNLLVACTIHNIWQYEHKTKTTYRWGRVSHNKIVGFVEDLDKIEQEFKPLEQRYQDAMKKLSQGVATSLG